jgi:solute carrier family 25 phosphate transporter 3
MSASATAEFLGDIALAPFEAMKVRIQADDPKNRRWPKSMRELMPIMWKSEGISAYYKGLVPLWSRQIPYTVSKFWCFERTVEAIYKHVLTKPKNQYSQGQHLGVSLGAGYIAGVFCAVVSHPADWYASFLVQLSPAYDFSIIAKII